MRAINPEMIGQLKASLLPSILVVTPASEYYEESIKRWATSAEKPAALVVFPTSAGDVSKVVLFSIANSLEIAVCGGGHSTSGSSSTYGVSIDLSKLRACTVDVENKTISVEGGALWRDVDKALGAHVGGLTLGGGYGWLTAQYGLTIDNLLSVQYVLANGSIVTASSTQSPDLFWAARGAGQAFGIAKNFVFQAHEQKNSIWAGMLVFPPSQLRGIINASNQLIDKCIGKSNFAVAFVCPPPAFKPCVSMLVFYNGSEEEGWKFYEPLFSLKPLADTTSTMPYENINGTPNDANPFGFRRSIKGSASLAPVDPQQAEDVFQDFAKFTKDVPDAATSMAMFEFISPRKLIQVSQTETAFANRGNYFNTVFMTCWTKEENGPVCRDWIRTMAAKADKLLQKRMAAGTDNVTKYAVGQYSNYDNIGEKGQVLFGVNFPRLVDLKKRYDPGIVLASA